MEYRKLGKTGLEVSEIGLGGEWLERHTKEETIELIKYCEKKGINIIDCWMAEPNVRTNIGHGIKDNREHWIVQGHIGSTWQNNQYFRTRDIDKAKIAFNDLLERLQTSYIDLGMIHYVDEEKDFDEIMAGKFFEYVQELKNNKTIRHIGISTHNPIIAKKAAISGKIEVILFSINPAFDILPPTETIDEYFKDDYDEKYKGINPERTELYSICEENNVAITVMKGYAGGRLFKKETSPFGVALTPIQCLHYALTRPSVASVVVGYDTIKQVDEAIAYETATYKEKDYSEILANAPKHSYYGQCTYCGHCAPCPVEIDIAMVNKYYDLAVMHDDIPATIKDHYNSLKANAKDCIECGGCETRCPFGVKVVDKMNKAKNIFKQTTQR